MDVSSVAKQQIWNQRVETKDQDFIFFALKPSDKQTIS